MSTLKSADVSCSPFGFCKAGQVFESNVSRNQYRIESVESGNVYWRKLEPEDKVSKDKLDGDCNLP